MSYIKSRYFARDSKWAIISGSITTIKTLGRSSLHWDTLNNCIKLSISTSECLNQKLMDLLRVKEKKNPIGLHGKNIYGFLK